MPAGYEAMRDSFIAKGMSRKDAEEKAARIWNSKHPDNPVGRHEPKARGERLKDHLKKGKQ